MLPARHPPMRAESPVSSQARRAAWRAFVARCAGAAAIVCAFFTAAPAFAQITQVSSSTQSPTSNVSTLTVTRPASVVANDVLVAMVAYRGGTNISVSATPSGWTEVTTTDDATRLGMHLYYKVAGASEASSYAWTLSASTRAAAGIIAFRGVNTGNPVAAFATQVNGDSASLTAPSVTPGVANSMLVAFWAIVHGSATITDPASMTGDFSIATAGTTNGLALAGSHETVAATTATGTRVATASISEPNTGFLLALRAAPFVSNLLVEATGGGAIGAQVAASPFNIRITARDSANATLTSFTGTVTITSSGTLSQGGGVTASFVNGVLASHTVALSGTGTFTLTATAGNGATGTSASFTVAALSSFLLAEYRMDETGWSGTAGEVLDTSGNGHHGRSVNAGNASTTPAVAGSPGTCGYGVFNRNNAYLELPTTFPNLSTSFTISAWIRPTFDINGDQRILADDEANGGGYGFSLGDEGGSGLLRFFSRNVSPISLDTGSVITLNNWYFVAAVHDVSAKTRTIYIFNAAGTLLGSWSGTYTGTWGTDNGRAGIGGETVNGGSEAVPQWRFGGNIDELRVHTRALSQAQLESLQDTTRPCAATNVPGGFNAFETSTAGGAITGVIKTKIAGTAFSLAVVALNTARTAILTTFTGTVTVEVLDADNNTGALNATTGCRSTWTNIATVAPNPAFVAGDNGRDTVAFAAVANAYREARVRVTYTSGGTTVIGCSTDAFAIRPSSFASVQATDGTDTTTGVTRVLNNSAATSGVVHRAGRAFSVLGAAVSSSGSTVSGYDGTPSLAVTSCTVPAGCTAGTFSASLSASAGAITGTATYSEAGVITATMTDATFASIDAADSSAAERTISSTQITIGRFVPQAYRLSTSTTPTFAPPACSTGPVQSFVFVGQSFAFGTTPVVLATPVNFAGAVLANARPRFGTSAVATGASATGAPVAMTGNVSASSVTTSATATIGFTGTSFSFTRGTAPVASFTPTIAMTVDINDTTETATSGNTAILDETRLTISPIAFNPGASPFYYGRLQLYPTVGDYRRDLVVPLEVQAWNGLGWMPLTAAATCISAGATTFAYSAPTGGLSSGGNFNCATRVASTVTTSNGRAAIPLANPAYTSTTQPSAMTLTLNLLGAAAGNSCSAINTSTAATTIAMPWLASPTGANPSARVTWGRTRGDAQYMRERFD